MNNEGTFFQTMELKSIIDALGTPLIITMMGLVVNFARSMSQNLQDVATNLKLIQQELHLQIKRMDEIVDDHESRLRIVELKKQGGRHD